MSSTQAPSPPRPARSRPLRPILKLGAVAISLLVLVWVALTLTGQLFRSEQRAVGSFPDVSRLHVATEFESVEVVGSESATTISVEREWSWSLRKPRTAMVQTGDTLALTSDCPITPGPECRGTIRIVVPVGLAVDLSSGDGDLHLANLSGLMTLLAEDGSIAADQLRSAGISTVSDDGDVHLVFSKPPDTVAVTSRDGNVHIELPDTREAYRVDAATGDGAQSVTVPTDPAANRRVEIDTADGAIQINTRK